MKVVTTEKRYSEYVMKLYFKDAVKFSENLMAVAMGKTKIKIEKPVYFWEAILDLSKLITYEFHHYDYMLPKYRSKVK